MFITINGCEDMKRRRKEKRRSEKERKQKRKLKPTHHRTQQLL